MITEKRFSQFGQLGESIKEEIEQLKKNTEQEVQGSYTEISTIVSKRTEGLAGKFDKIGPSLSEKWSQQLKELKDSQETGWGKFKREQEKEIKEIDEVFMIYQASKNKIYRSLLDLEESDLSRSQAQEINLWAYQIITQEAATLKLKLKLIIEIARRSAAKKAQDNSKEWENLVEGFEKESILEELSTIQVELNLINTDKHILIGLINAIKAKLNQANKNLELKELRDIQTSVKGLTGSVRRQLSQKT